MGKFTLCLATSTGYRDPAEEVQLELGTLKFDLRLGRPAVEGGSIAFQDAHFDKGRGTGWLTQNKYGNEVPKPLCDLGSGCCPVLSGEQAVAKCLDLVTKGNPKFLEAKLGERDLFVSNRLAKTYPAGKLERLCQRHGPDGAGTKVFSTQRVVAFSADLATEIRVRPGAGSTPVSPSRRDLLLVKVQLRVFLVSLLHEGCNRARLGGGGRSQVDGENK